MRKNAIILFVLLLLSICYSRQMQIPISSENSPTTIEIYNLKGQKVLTKEFSRYNSAPISLSNNLANQVYIMRIKNGNEVFTRKFMPDTKIQFVGNFANTNKISTNETFHFPEIQRQTLLREEPLGDSVTNIIFINGMRNTRQKAERNLSRIRTAYAEKLEPEEYPGKYKFTLGYNKTYSLLKDLAEVMLQWETEIDRTANVNAFEWLASIIDVEYYEEAMGVSAYAKKNPDEQKTYLFKRAKHILESERESIMAAHSETTNDLRKITDESFENRQRVIIIAHSQGNLFANELIDYYNKNNKDEEMKRTEVLNIAPPTVSKSKSWYYTNNDDGVINYIRENSNPSMNILPGFQNRVISEKDPRDNRRHSFWESYFHDNLESRRLIDSVLLKHCKELPFWEPIYHPDDVAQINKLIEEHGLNWKYNKPENWDENLISWTDEETNRKVTRLRAAGVLGDVSLDLPMLDSLNFSNVSNGQISSLDVSKCANLTYLNVAENQLSSLDLSNNTVLIYLFVRDNKLTSLDLTNNTKLITLNANNNRLTSLDVSNNTALIYLWVNSNRLTSLNVSNNTALTTLGVNDNKLTSLDVSNNPKLTNLSCNGNLKDNICP